MAEQLAHLDELEAEAATRGSFEPGRDVFWTDLAGEIRELGEQWSALGGVPSLRVFTDEQTVGYIAAGPRRLSLGFLLNGRGPPLVGARGYAPWP